METSEEGGCSEGHCNDDDDDDDDDDNKPRHRLRCLGAAQYWPCHSAGIRMMDQDKRMALTRRGKKLRLTARCVWVWMCECDCVSVCEWMCVGGRVCVCECVCECVSVWVNVCVWVCVGECQCKCVSVRARLSVCACACVCVWECACEFVRARVCVYVYKCVWVCVSVSVRVCVSQSSDLSCPLLTVTHIQHAAHPNSLSHNTDRHSPWCLISRH